MSFKASTYWNEHFYIYLVNLNNQIHFLLICLLNQVLRCFFLHYVGWECTFGASDDNCDELWALSPISPSSAGEDPPGHTCWCHQLSSLPPSFDTPMQVWDALDLRIMSNHHKFHMPQQWEWCHARKEVLFNQVFKCKKN